MTPYHDPDQGFASNTCPLCGYEGEMAFCKTPKGQRTYWQCPNVAKGCGLQFYEDNRRKPSVGQKELDAWDQGVAGWEP